MKLVRVASAYRMATVATTICVLEAAGFDVFCPGFHTTVLLPHYALSFGGVPICVPKDQAADALELLRSFTSPNENNRAVLSQALNCLGWLGFGVSTPWSDLALVDKVTPLT